MGQKELLLSCNTWLTISMNHFKGKENFDFFWKLSRYTKIFFNFFFIINKSAFVCNCFNFILLSVNSTIKYTFNKQAFSPLIFRGSSFDSFSSLWCTWTHPGLANLCVGYLRLQWLPNWITCTFLSPNGEPSLIKTMWLMTPKPLPELNKSLSQSLCCIGSCLHTRSYSKFNTSSQLRWIINTGNAGCFSLLKYAMILFWFFTTNVTCRCLFHPMSPGLIYRNIESVLFVMLRPSDLSREQFLTHPFRNSSNWWVIVVWWLSHSVGLLHAQHPHTHFS